MHKYAYVHGDPIQGTDPSGQISITSFAVGFASQARLRAQSQASNIAALYQARNFASLIRLAALLANSAYDGISGILTLLDLVTFDPSDLLEFQNVLPKFTDLFSSASSSSGPDIRNLPNRLVDSHKIKLNLKLRGKLGKVLQLVNTIPRATERIGEFGAAWIASLLGFNTTNLVYSNTGIDAVLYNETLDMFMVIEAKGSNSARRLGRLSSGQFNHQWIKSRLDKLLKANRNRADAVALERAIDANKPIAAAVVSLNIKAGLIRFGGQIYQNNQHQSAGVSKGISNDFQPWKGFK